MLGSRGQIGGQARFRYPAPTLFCRGSPVPAPQLYGHSCRDRGGGALLGLKLILQLDDAGLRGAQLLLQIRPPSGSAPARWRVCSSCAC